MNAEQTAATPVSAHAEPTPAPAEASALAAWLAAGAVPSPRPQPERTPLPLESHALVADLYTYPLLRYGPLLRWWLFLGVFGAHRFYLGRIGTGALQTLTYGGGLVWWLTDYFRLRRLLNEANSEQMRRRTLRLPPRELAFLPSLEVHALEQPPAWATARPVPTPARFLRSLLLHGAVLYFVGKVLAEQAKAHGAYEPIAAVLLLLALMVGQGPLLRLQRWRLPRELAQWHLKLRLYYHYTPPPSAMRALVEPMAALFSAPFQERRQGVAKLYMEVGGLFAAAFTVLSLLSGSLRQHALALDWLEVGKEWMESTVTVFFLVVALVAPIGALLMKYEMAPQAGSRPLLARWGLVLATLAGLTAGLV